MELFQLLNKALNCIIDTSGRNIEEKQKAWFSPNKILYIPNERLDEFNSLLEKIYTFDKFIYNNFTRKFVFKAIEDELIRLKQNNLNFSKEDGEKFLENFKNIKPFSVNVIAPISGIRLDNKDKIVISVFEIGYIRDISIPLAAEDGYYIKVHVNDIYDRYIAIEKAENAFSDFIKLIVFISGKNDKRILIKTGLPLYPSISHEQMYVETKSYQLLDSSGKFISSDISSEYIEKIPVDNEFFSKNRNFNKLWEIYKRKYLGQQITDMEARIINASIALGESALSRNIKNSIIYTSMALEILFSFDEGSLFQKSIGEKLSDMFAFMVGRDKESRINASKLLKKFYRLRSALVHGGEASITNDYIIINIFLRAVINELLNNKKYIGIRNISQLYNMVKEAQYSY